MTQGSVQDNGLIMTSYHMSPSIVTLEEEKEVKHRSNVESAMAPNLKIIIILIHTYLALHFIYSEN